MQVTTIGLDIAKNVFQIHGIDANEKVVVRKQLRRSQVLAFFAALAPCLIGMKACATAHYWARELTKLGPKVRLMPAKDVKAYVKRNKNDAADAAATMRAGRNGATGPIGLGFRALKGGGAMVGVILDQGEPRVVVSTFLPTAVEGDRPRGECRMWEPETSWLSPELRLDEQHPSGARTPLVTAA